MLDGLFAIATNNRHEKNGYVPLVKDFEIHSSCDCEIGGVPAQEASEIVVAEVIGSSIDCSCEAILLSCFGLLPAEAMENGFSPCRPSLEVLLLDWTLSKQKTRAATRATHRHTAR